MVKRISGAVVVLFSCILLTGCFSTPGSTANCNHRGMDWTGITTVSDTGMATEIGMQSAVRINAFWPPATKGSTGSGVIYKISGRYAWAFTNYHVIYKFAGGVSTNIDVYFYGHEDVTNNYTVQMIGGDIDADIAIIKIDFLSVNGRPDCIRAADLYTGNLCLGERVVAIGNPIGLGLSISSGVISRLNCKVLLDKLDQAENATGTIEMNGLIRTDAAINPGNSGGGLFNIEGKLIGIVSSKLDSTSTVDVVEGFGYAIPISVAITIANSKNATKI